MTLSAYEAAPGRRPIPAARIIAGREPRDGVGSDTAGSVPVQLLDRAGRQRHALALQRTAGNRAATALLGADRSGRAGAGRAPGAGITVQREADAPTVWDLAPNPYAIRTRGGGSVSELAGNPYAGERDPVTLSNPRFAGQPRLERIARGEASLSSADNGTAMKRVQQALIDLGFELVRHERDGQFGEETRTAIRLFRSRRSIPGDELSARALGELDRSAPPPGKQEEHYFDYERLFADGYLDVTLAVGFDEGGSHTRMINEARAWLKDRGFTLMAPAVGKPEEHRLRRNVTYPTRGGDRISREVIVRVQLVPPGPGAKGQYAQGLADSEIAIYNGHARRGIGPDFDEDKSASENFVIGVASALHAAGRAIAPTRVEQHHYVIDRRNDLEAMTRSGAFDREKYRIWLFEACTTLAYFDELRGGILPDHVDRENLDLMGTRKPAPLITEMASSLAMLDGILAARTIEQITTAMDQAGTDVANAIPDTEISAADRRLLSGWTQGLHVHEGAGDNPVAASAP